MTMAIDCPSPKIILKAMQTLEATPIQVMVNPEIEKIANMSKIAFLDDIKYDDNSKCEFDSLEDAYKALFEESLKIKAKKLKVNNTSLKINVVNDLNLRMQIRLMKFLP